MKSRLPLFLAVVALFAVGTFAAVTPVPSAEADNGFDISYFYNPLSPHGEWVVQDPYGWVWMPEQVDYGWRPYTNGYWAWVEPYGWTWISAEPWGWATYHYGRWLYTDDYGWVWVPGTVWSPAWVQYRYSDPYVGWAPLPPGPNWRYDSGYQDLSQQLAIGPYAWSFVGLRYFADPLLSSRLYSTAYNPYLVQNTAWSTRYAPAEGGIANLSVDPALVERASGAAVPRRRLREASAPDKGGVSVEGDSVVVFRPRLEAKAPSAKPPVPTRRATGPTPKVDADAWATQRREQLKAHLERQRKALEEQDVDVPAQPTERPPTPGRPPGARPPEPAPGMAPGMGPEAAPGGDAAARRQAAMQALEEERKRMEQQIERRRRRMEQGPGEGPPASSGMGEAPPAMGEAPPAMGDDHPGMGGGMGGGMD